MYNIGVKAYSQTHIYLFKEEKQMKTKIFILTALIFSLILFTVSCIADDPADTNSSVSRSESTPQEESVNESTPPEESKPAEESKLEESIPPEESKPEESEPPEESKPAEESEPAETSNTEDKTYAQPMVSEGFPKTPDVITVPEGYEEIHSLIDSGEYTKAYKLLIEKENDIYATQLLRNFGSFYETQRYQYHDTVRGIDGTYNVFNYFYENGFPKSVYHTMYEYQHGSGCLSDGVTGFYFDNNGLLHTVSNSSHKYYYDSEGRLIKAPTYGTDIRIQSCFSGMITVCLKELKPPPILPTTFWKYEDLLTTETEELSTTKPTEAIGEFTIYKHGSTMNREELQKNPLTAKPPSILTTKTESL